MNGPTINYGICGVCEQPGATTIWTNHASEGAHDHCREYISELERDLVERITNLFRGREAQLTNAAHCIAITAIRRTLDNPIRTYVANHGAEPFRELIRTIGIPTVTQYYRVSRVNETILTRAAIRQLL